MDNIARLEQLCAKQEIACRKDVSLKDYSTFKIGGGCPLLVSPGSGEEIAAVLSAARELDIRLMVLGKGSNVLFADEGFAGVILHLGSGFAGVRLLDDTTLACDSGASLVQVCRFALEHSLSGLEFAYGIPGAVGGAVYMNAGAYGGEMKDVLQKTTHLASDGTAGNFCGEEMRLDYRHSAYSDGDFIITGAVLRLQPGDPTEIRGKMEDFMHRRRTKQPLEFPSAGSTFRRPAGNYASALIDQCGLKGLRVGGAIVSEKHAGFVINAGDATCRDVKALIRLIQEKVKTETGYELECEVKFID